MTGISKSQVTRLCGEIDDKVKAFLGHPIAGDWLYLWIDATYVKVRQNGVCLSGVGEGGPTTLPQHLCWRWPRTTARQFSTPTTISISPPFQAARNR